MFILPGAFISLALLEHALEQIRVTQGNGAGTIRLLVFYGAYALAIVEDARVFFRRLHDLQ